MSKKLPHEGHVPTLPGRTNTGEKGISYLVPQPSRTARYWVGPTRYAKGFQATLEGFALAIDYRDAVHAGLEPISKPVDPFDAWVRRMRDDSNDAGPRGHERKPSTVRGTHRATRPTRKEKFEWKTEDDSIEVVAVHVARMLARRFTGLDEWPLEKPNLSPRAVEFAALYGIVVREAL